MSTETAAATAKKESLFSKKNRKLLVDPLDDSKPITVQVLGICSALAITVQLQQAVIMSLSVLFVMIGGNVIVSLLRNMIPDRIRIIVHRGRYLFIVVPVSVFAPDQHYARSCVPALCQVRGVETKRHPHPAMARYVRQGPVNCARMVDRRLTRLEWHGNGADRLCIEIDELPTG